MLVRMICREDGSKQFEIVSTDGWSAVTVTLHVGPRTLRMVDQFGTALFPWHLDGRTLRIGNVTYQRRLFLKAE